ncbi:MAG: YicC family protein [Ruminococcaceae bacterium]|nr:YicC family protein [Oscillospiraceae bacterium]
MLIRKRFMANSMTAFGRAKALTADGSKNITCEIKSVNSRYLDCSVKISRVFSYLEEKVKAYLTQKGIVRGKVEIYIGVEIIEQKGIETALDSAAALSYIQALYKLRDEFGLPDDISVMSVAQNKELFCVVRPEEDAQRDWLDVQSVLDVAIESFLERRKAEGERLVEDIAAKIEGIRAIAERIKDLSANDIQGYSAKLEERIKKLLSDFDVEISEQRILTEAAIFADKAAIDEELVRLESHFKTFYEIIASPEPCGRKLDFLLQEMNREINTTGSKASNADIAHLVVDVKAELEKIREQIQNIE